MLDANTINFVNAGLEVLNMSLARRRAMIESMEARMEARHEAMVQSMQAVIEAGFAAVNQSIADHLKNCEAIMMEHRRACAPLVDISRMPYEIMARIFVLGNDGYRGYGTSPTSLSELYWALDYPLRLSHVNRHFRHIAVTTALLWTDIYVRNEFMDPITALYLSRSQGCLLDIRLYTPSDTRLLEKVDTLVRLLPVHRWRSLRMNVDLHRLRDVMRNVGPAPNLKLLELKGDTSASYDGSDEAVKLLNPFEGHTPLLSSMTLHNASPSWSGGMFSALTNLCLKLSELCDYTSLQQHLNLLQHSRSLTTLTIMGDNSVDIFGDCPAFTVTKLDALQTFIITDMGRGGTRCILSSVYAPAVLDFTLSGVDLENAVDAISLFAPFRRTLQRLSLDNIYFSDPPLPARSFPAVEDLGLVHPDSLIEQISDATKNTAEVLFPELERLTILSGDRSSFNTFKGFLLLRRALNKEPLKILLPQHIADANKAAFAGLEEYANIKTFIYEDCDDDSSIDTDYDSNSD